MARVLWRPGNFPADRNNDLTTASFEGAGYEPGKPARTFSTGRLLAEFAVVRTRTGAGLTI